MKVEIYSRDNCSYCVKAKALLEKNDIAYEEIHAPDHRDALIARVTADTGNAPKTLPQIYIDGGYVGGYDQLVVFLNK